MPSNSRNKKKKSKSKNNNNNNKKNNNNNNNTLSRDISAEVFDESEDYPTSRVIKRAPNGDVIVESITPAISAESSSKKKKNNKKSDTKGGSSMANVLDLHWESLSPEEKKVILRIDKNDVFQIIQKYQSDHSCNCSVCGKRHLSLDQEMERIYDMLYEIDKIKDPEITPIKFHLSIIKDLQISKSNNNSISNNSNNNNTNDSNDLLASPQTAPVIPRGLDNITSDDGDLKEFLASNNANSLKEEILHFKQAKQLEHQQHKNKNNISSDNVHEEFSRQLPSPLLEEEPQRSQVKQQYNNPEASYIEDKLLKSKYLQFTHKYISSYPKIAEEYVKRVMMYPEMRQVTDQLMASDGDGFLKAIENFVIERARDEDGNIDEGYYQKLGDVRSFTTILHKGQPLTPQEYTDLQKNIAERMTSSYDTKRREFKEISPLEKELFTRFMFGEDREQFGEMVMQSFREKFDNEFGGASVSASLAAAAAAATLTNPLSVSNNYSSVQSAKDEYNESYDYSDYEEDEDESEFFSEYTDGDDDDDDDDGLSNYGGDTDSDNECLDSSHHHRSNDRIFVQHGEDVDIDDQEHYYHDNDDESHHMSHEEDYESEVDEATRLEEGRKLIQIAITKLLQSRILESYHTKQADVNRLKLLQELEDEKEKKRAKEEKKQRKKEKEKERRKLQQKAKEEERLKKLEEEERLRKESEEREKERREAQRKKVEEAKKKKDEERRRRLEEQRKREEQQEKQRKLKEEIKRKKEEERKRKEREQKEKQEAEARKRKEQKEKEEKLAKEAKEREEKLVREQEAETPKQKNQSVNKANNMIKQESTVVNNTDTSVRSNSNSLNTINNSQFHPGIFLSNGKEGNIDNMGPNNDILPMIGESLLGNTTSFSNTTTLALNKSMNHQTNIIPTSQPISSSTASSLLPSSLWNNITSSQSSNTMFNTVSHQNTSFLSLSNTDGFNSITQKIGMHGSHYQHPQSQQQQLVPDNGISKSLNDELNNLTSLLQSTNINDSLYPRSSALNSSSLWTDPKLTTGNPSNSINNSNPAASLMPSNKLLGHDIPVSNSMAHSDRSVHHRKSIWDDDLPPINSVSISTSANFPLSLNSSNIQPLPTMDSNNHNKHGNNNNDNFASNSTIWDNTDFSNTPQMNPTPIGLTTTTSTVTSHADINGILRPTHHPIQPNSINDTNGESLSMNMNANSLNDHVIFDLICRAYSTVIQKQPSNHNFVPVDTLYHQVNSITPLDYHTFINKVLEMRILHGCEILNSSMGTISHVKIYLDTIPHGNTSSILEQRRDTQENRQSQINSSMLLNVVGSNGS